MAQRSKTPTSGEILALRKFEHKVAVSGKQCHQSRMSVRTMLIGLFLHVVLISVEMALNELIHPSTIRRPAHSFTIGMRIDNRW